MGEQMLDGNKWEKRIGKCNWNCSLGAPWAWTSSCLSIKFKGLIIVLQCNALGMCCVLRQGYFLLRGLEVWNLHILEIALWLGVYVSLMEAFLRYF